MAHWTEDIDFQNISKDMPYGFEGFKTIGELCEGNCADIPEQMGIYMVLAPTGEKPGFNSSNPAYAANSKEPKDLKLLDKNWVNGTPVLYIGKAGGSEYATGLRDRLSEYFRWKDGKANGHRGGRDLWQINNPEKLVVAWRIVEGEEPRDCERSLLKKFKRDFNGMLPFANQQQ